MNKIIIILICFFVSVSSYGQFINTVKINSPTTLGGQKGGAIADSGTIISSIVYADTTAANWCAISHYSGALIQVAGGQIWYRTLSPNKWNEISSTGSPIVSISQGYGIIATPSPITTVGTITADTTALSTKLNVLNQLNKFTGTTNITSIGTLSILTVSNTITTGTVYSSGLNGTIGTPSQPNITLVGTLTALTVTNSITASNYYGSGKALTGVLTSANAGTGISVSTNGGVFTVTNTSPSSGGTVTSFSSTASSGINDVITNSTTTPTQVLSLGNITPSTVSTGTITATGLVVTGSVTSTFLDNRYVYKAIVDTITATKTFNTGTIAYQLYDGIYKTEIFSETDSYVQGAEMHRNNAPPILTGHGFPSFVWQNTQPTGTSYHAFRDNNNTPLFNIGLNNNYTSSYFFLNYPTYLKEFIIQSEHPSTDSIGPVIAISTHSSTIGTQMLFDPQGAVHYGNMILSKGVVDTNGYFGKMDFIKRTFVLGNTIPYDTTNTNNNALQVHGSATVTSKLIVGGDGQFGVETLTLIGNKNSDFTGYIAGNPNLGSAARTVVSLQNGSGNQFSTILNSHTSANPDRGIIANTSGDIVISPSGGNAITANGNQTVSLSTVPNAVGSFMTISNTGLVSQRSLTQTQSDLGIVSGVTSIVAGSNITISSATGAVTINAVVPSVSGTTNKVAKFTSSNTLGNSLITDDGTTIVANTVNSFLSTGIVTSGNLTMNAGGAFNLYNAANNRAVTIQNQGSTGTNTIAMGDNTPSTTSFTLQGSLVVTGATITTTGNIQGAVITATNSLNANSFVNNGTATFVTPSGNGYSREYASTTIGHVVYGQGSSVDVSILDHTGSGGIQLPTGGAGNVIINTLAGTGSRAVLAATDGTLSAPISDITVKEKIKLFTKYGIYAIMQLRPVTFKYKNGWEKYGSGTQIGMIAQEVEKVIPEAVFTTPSTGKKGIDYNTIPNAITVKALQDLQHEIDNKDKQIKLLSDRLDKIEKLLLNKK